MFLEALLWLWIGLHELFSVAGVCWVAHVGALGVGWNEGGMGQGWSVGLGHGHLLSRLFPMIEGFC